MTVVAVTSGESEVSPGYSRYRCDITADLGLQASTWEGFHKQWQATNSRAEYASVYTMPALEQAADDLRSIRDSIGRKLKARLRDHVLWPWLEQHPGMGGVHVARMISMIGDPLRFPGRKCALGHHVPEDWEGDCPISKRTKDGELSFCGALVGGVRTGTGVRSLWHFCGLHGPGVRKKKGKKCSWRPPLRSLLLMDCGVADQIVRHRVAPYRDKYDETKVRICEERGDVQAREIAEKDGPTLHVVGDAGSPSGIDTWRGVAASSEGEAEKPDAIGRQAGLPLWRVEKIARVVAVKAFVGDLLMEWKSLC